jgi:glyoxylase-like metal-dependent hydrolase (beta-lactamase superfamily II)
MTQWWDPVPEQVGSDLFRIPLPLPSDGLKAVNVYALGGGDGVVLIDGGWAFAGSFAHLESGLAHVGLRPGDVRHVLVTHAHQDHYTQAVELRERHGVRVSLGEEERDGLHAVMEAVRQRTPTRRLEALIPAGAARFLAELDARSRPLGGAGWQLPDDWVRNRERYPAGKATLEAIATPGHTAGHVVYRDAERGLLFSGDHVLPHITPSIGFEAAPVRWPLRDYLDSLRLMLTLPDTRLLPAHGPVGDSVHARVRELLRHHHARLLATMRAVSDGAHTGLEVAGRLTWTRRNHPLDALNLYNQCLAISETMAHLDVLVLRGELCCATHEDGVRRFDLP